MLLLQGRSILPVRWSNGTENKTTMLTTFLSNCKLSKLYIAKTSHCKPMDKMHHRIKDIQATYLATILLLTMVGKQEAFLCLEIPTE